MMCLFLVLSLNAQKRLARITFKDSAVVNGYAKFIDGGKSIEFADKKGAKVVRYSFENIEKVEMLKDGKRKTYTYIQIINQGTVKLAEVLESGSLSLYRFSYEEEGWRSAHAGYPGQDITVSLQNESITVPIVGGPVSSDVFVIKTFKDLCVKREGEEMARYFKDTATGANFKQMGAYYFRDCPMLAERIASGKFNLRKLREIVVFYNASCE